MADAKRTVEIIFKGVDKTALATQTAINNVSSFSDGVASATQPIADFAVGALKLEASILAIGAAATIASIFVASDFQAAALDLKKVLSDTEPLEKYKDLAIEISNEYGVAASEILASMADFRQASFTADEAVQLTRNSLDLLIAGGVAAADASSLLVASLKGFGEEAETASFIVDLLNGVSNEYATNLNELLIGFAQLSPVAKAAGLSLQETVGVLTPGIEVFRSGSEVATALRTSLINLVSGTAPVAEALGLLGVSQKNANGELRSARDIYFEVAAALQGVDENQQLYIAGLLAGKNQAARFLAVTEGLNTTLRISGDEFEFVGSAAAEVAIRMASAEVAADRTKVAFTNMLTAVGTPFLEEFTGIADAVSAIFKVIADEVEGGELEGLVQYIESTLGALEDNLKAVAQNLPEALNLADLSGFTDGLDAIANAFGGLFDEIDLTTAEGLASAIESIGQAFNALSQFTGGIIESFGPLFDQLVSLTDNMLEFDESIFKVAGNAAGFVTQANLLASGLNSLLPIVETLLGILVLKQGAGLVGAFGSAASALTAPSGLIAALGKAGLVGAAGAAGYAVGSVLSAGLDNAANKFTKTEQSLGTLIYDLVNGAADAEKMSDLLNVAADSADKAAISIAGAVESIDISASLEPVVYTADAVSEAMLSLQENVVNAGIGFEEFALSSFGLLAAQNGLRPILAENTDAIIGFERGIAKAVDENDKLSDSMFGLVPIYDELTGKITGYERGLITSANAADAFANKTTKAAASTADIARETEKAATAQARWNEVILQARVDLQLETIKSNTQIAVSEIEAGAIKIKAAYESINVTIESTGKTITDLFGIMAGGDLSLREKFGLEEQINIENERREKALELQEKLTEAQIKEMKARSDALRRGDGLITIEGDGLQPHLEAFMWEILRTIQVRVNEDGLDMLLGGVTTP